MNQDNPVTVLLQDWCSGNAKALSQLIPLVHDGLRQIANRYMKSENDGHTLQATALINEAYIKLVDCDVSWQNRAHFMAIAARSMRRILVDHARANQREKRGGQDLMVTLHDTQIAGQGHEPDLLDIEDALHRLAELDERKSNIIELSFFGGMTYDEIAEAVGVSPATVDRELRFAKAWLKRHLSESN